MRNRWTGRCFWRRSIKEAYDEASLWRRLTLPNPEGDADLSKLAATLLSILPAAFGQTALTTAQIAKTVSPSVVALQGKTDSGDVPGSGFIISKDGKIVTTLQAIRDLKTGSVHLANGEIFDSFSVLGTDERRDLAIIQVGGFNLPMLELGNSDTATAGDSVAVVESHRGLEGTVTAGVLSAMRDTSDGFKVLQTNAAVNPGNSGGPVVNGKGQAIGVVSFKLRAAEGLNVAIPINYVRGLLNNLHEPLSLEQLRRSLAGPTSGVQESHGASLKETLDWLKEKIPLAASHYTFATVRSKPDMGRTKDVTLRTLPTRFESCTVSFDFTEVDIFEKYRDRPIVTTTHQTIPLGALSGGEIVKSYFPLALTDSTKVEVWTVVLHTTSKVILNETYEDLGDTRKSESSSVASLIFYEESIAKRVLDAFNHAADLCRGKEAF
jgi:hypothetical protein